MVEELIHGNTEFVEITSDYRYVLGRTLGNLLNFKLAFEGRQWEKEGVLDAIAARLKQRAKEFASAQRIYDTGQLIDQIDAYPEGGTVHLVSLAKKHEIIKEGRRVPYYNPKSTTRTLSGGYYGGHVEFGHKTSGGFYPARPYLRPALRIVSEESKGEMIGTIQSIFSGAMAGFDQRGFTFNGRTLMYTGLAFGRNFSYKTSPSYEHGLSKLTGYDKRYGRWNPSDQQRNLSKYYSAVRGGSKSNNVIRDMGWRTSDKVKAGSYVKNQGKINPNKGRGQLNRVLSGHDPNYNYREGAARAFGSVPAQQYYARQVQENRAKSTPSSVTRFVNYMRNEGSLRRK